MSKEHNQNRITGYRYTQHRKNPERINSANTSTAGLPNSIFLHVQHMTSTKTSNSGKLLSIDPATQISDRNSILKEIGTGKLLDEVQTPPCPLDEWDTNITNSKCMFSNRRHILLRPKEDFHNPRTQRTMLHTLLQKHSRYYQVTNKLRRSEWW